MIIYPSSEIKSLRNAVFLAGPCPRGEDKWDWRGEAIDLFNRFGFNGDIITPTNPNYDGDLEKQTAWEHKMLCYASAIMFWIPRSKEHPAFTTNIEFGEWYEKGNAFVGFPDDSIKNDYLGVRLKQSGMKRYKTLEQLVKAVIEYFNRKSTFFFTSDTHFSAKRTLELSYRPFPNVTEMDNQLISNWNKRVTMNDIVYHLGDFGNQKIVHLLNFKKMYFLPGNYEKRDGDLKELESDGRVVILDESNNYFRDVEGDTVYGLVHEPYVEHDPMTDNSLIGQMFKEDFYLFGHIHRLQLVKKNGINVGIDGNRFMPMSIQELRFLKGGIDNFFDENVFTSVVG